jgi:hypothetical protein
MSKTAEFGGKSQGILGVNITTYHIEFIKKIHYLCKALKRIS